MSGVILVKRRVGRSRVSDPLQPFADVRFREVLRDGQFGNFNSRSIAWNRGSLRSGSRFGSPFS
jgi:hypothetical protein